MPTLMQIITTRPETQAVLDRDYTVLHASPAPDAAWLAEHGAAIEAVVTGGHVGISPALLAGLPNLKLVAINGVGYDKIDLDAVRARGVRVTNTPDVLTEDVADLAVGLALSLLRRLPHAHAHVRAGHWPTKGEMALTTKLSGKRVGIFGLGRIGLAVAKRMGGFTDKIGYTGTGPKDVPYTFHPDAVALAAASDLLVVCAAASGATNGLIGRAVFEALGPRGFLVNIARGSIVDEPALVAALRDGTIAGAGLDVFANEPHVPAELLGMENVVLTPHVASGTHETRQAMGQLMLDNIAAFFAGKELPTPVV